MLMFHLLADLDLRLGLAGLCDVQLGRGGFAAGGRPLFMTGPPEAGRLLLFPVTFHSAQPELPES